MNIKNQDIILYELEKIESRTGKIEKSIIDEWKELEKKGKQIAVISYKNISYIVGLLQVVGCLEPIIIAENGGSIQVGLNNPPSFFLRMIPTEEEKSELKEIKKSILQKFSQVWFMENEVILGVYAANLQEVEKLERYIFNLGKELNNVYIHKIKDSIYIIPKSITVQRAIENISSEGR